MKDNYTYPLGYLGDLSFVTEAVRTLGETIAAARRGESSWSTVLAQVEPMEMLSLIYLPLIESLCIDFDEIEDPLDREVQLRLWMVILHKMGRYWNSYRLEEQVKEYGVETWMDTIEKADESRRKSLIWHQLLSEGLKAKSVIMEFADLNHIQEGMRVELVMILDMLEPQQRTVFPVDKQWQSDALTFRKVEETDQTLLQLHFTPAIGKYLSIDSFAHPILAREYIRQSLVEMQLGTCLVLLAFERESANFVGCLTLNDINQYTAEIGLWVAEEQQGKGYGTALLEQAMTLWQTEIGTKEIIYSVEKENTKSIALCEKHGFQLEKELILEPTPLKNKYRTLLRYKK